MKKNNCLQQRFAKMAKYAVNSRLSFARNFILTEKSRSRSSPLLQAAKRQAVKKLRFSLNYIKIYRCIIQYRHPKQACFLSSNF
jgi:hypothetical protein